MSEFGQKPPFGNFPESGHSAAVSPWRTAS
jgi:hypothetical protein